MATLPRSAWHLFGFGGLWKKIAYGTAWCAGGALIGQLSSFLSGVLIARLLGKECYGRFGLLQSSIAVWSLIGGFGMSLTATRYLSWYRETEPAEAGRVIGSTTLLSIGMAGTISFLLIISARFVATSLSHDVALTQEIRVSATVIFVLCLLGVQQGILAGFECFRGAALINILRGLFLIPLTLAGILSAGLSGALWAITIASLAASILATFLIRDECRLYNIRPRWRFRREDWTMVGACAIPALAGGALVTPINWFVNMLLVKSPEGYSQLGILTAGINYRTAMLFFQSATGTVLLPALSSSSKTLRDQVLWSAVRVNALLAIFGVTAVAIAPDLPMHIFGKDFLGNGGVIVANVASGGLMLSSAPFVYWLTSVGRQWTIFCSNGFWALIYWLGSGYAVSQNWGAVGVATASVVAYTLQTGLYVGIVLSSKNRSLKC